MNSRSAGTFVQRVTMPSGGLLFAGLALILIATLLRDPEAVWLFREGPWYLGGLLILVGLLMLQAAWMEDCASRGPAAQRSSRRN